MPSLKKCSGGKKSLLKPYVQLWIAFSFSQKEPVPWTYKTCCSLRCRVVHLKAAHLLFEIHTQTSRQKLGDMFFSHSEISTQKYFSVSVLQVYASLIIEETEGFVSGLYCMSKLPDLFVFNKLLYTWEQEKVVEICIWGHKSNILKKLPISLFSADLDLLVNLVHWKWYQFNLEATRCAELQNLLIFSEMCVFNQVCCANSAKNV